MKSLKKRTKLLLLCSVLTIFFSSLPVSAAPAEVQQLKCGVTTQSSINLSWQGQSGISGYQVYRATAYDGKYKKVMTIHPNMHAFCNMKLSAGQEYYYKVRAFSGSGNNISYGKFSKILTAHTKISTKKAVTSGWVHIRKHAGTNHPVITTVNANTSLSVICTTKDKSGNSWSRIQCTINGKKITGYIKSSLLKIKDNITKTGIVTADYLNIRSDAGTSYRIVGTLKKNQKVTILGSRKSSSGVNWYLISFTQNGRTMKGYASSRYIKTL